MKFLRCLCTFNINIFPVGSYSALVPVIYMSSMRMLIPDMVSLGKQLLKNKDN